MCINTWHFTYDVDYPLLVTLQDPSAFDGEGLDFNFAFPVTIETNKGTKADYIAKDIESPEFSYDFCNDEQGTNVDIRVRNEFTNEEIYKADVTYTCVRLSCELGQTDAKAGIYRLQTKLPSTCTGGIIKGYKDGYMPGSATYDGSDYAELFLTPLKQFKVNFIKHDSDDLTRTDALQPGQTAIVFVRSTSHPSFERIYTTDSPQDLELIDGPASYELEVIIMEDNARLIGGYVGSWNVDYNEIADKSTINFNLVQKMPLAVTDEEQQAAAEYLFSDTSYQQSMRPVFS